MLPTVSVWTWLAVSRRPTCSDSCSWSTLGTSLLSHSAVWKSCCMNTVTLQLIITKVQDANSLIVAGEGARNTWLTKWEKRKHLILLSFYVSPLCLVFFIELEKWRSPEFYEREVHRMQLPFSGKLPGGCVTVEERQERRAQQLRRLQEINARRREEKLLQDQERLDRLMAVQARDLLSHLQFVLKVAVLHSCKMSSCNNTGQQVCAVQ